MITFPTLQGHYQASDRVGLFAALVLAGSAVFVVGLRPSVPLIMTAAFLFFFALPFANGMSQVIWQSKVAPDVQGRVFATRDMISMSMQLVAFLVIGLLADKIFEPLMTANGMLATSVGQWIGMGVGRGIGLMFSLLGLVIIAATIASYFYPRLALVEDELPDVLSAPGDQAFAIGNAD